MADLVMPWYVWFKHTHVNTHAVAHTSVNNTAVLCLFQVRVYNWDVSGFGFQVHAEERSEPPAAAAKVLLENGRPVPPRLLFYQLFSKRRTT